MADGKKLRGALGLAMKAGKCAAGDFACEKLIKGSGARLALLDAKYNKYLDAGLDVSNNRAFPHTPKRSASLGVDWAVFKGDWGKFNLYGDVNYLSAGHADPF